MREETEEGLESVEIFFIVSDGLHELETFYLLEDILGAIQHHQMQDFLNNIFEEDLDYE